MDYYEIFSSYKPNIKAKDFDVKMGEAFVIALLKEGCIAKDLPDDVFTAIEKYAKSHGLQSDPLIGGVEIAWEDSFQNPVMQGFRSYKTFSWRAPLNTPRRSKLPVNLATIWAYIQEGRDEDVWASSELLSNLLGYSRRQIDRVNVELENLGVLKKIGDGTYGKSPSKRRSPTYRVTVSVQHNQEQVQVQKQKKDKNHVERYEQSRASNVLNSIDGREGNSDLTIDSPIGAILENSRYSSNDLPHLVESKRNTRHQGNLVIAGKIHSVAEILGDFSYLPSFEENGGDESRKEGLVKQMMDFTGDSPKNKNNWRLIVNRMLRTDAGESALLNTWWEFHDKMRAWKRESGYVAENPASVLNEMLRGECRSLGIDLTRRKSALAKT